MKLMLVLVAGLAFIAPAIAQDDPCQTDPDGSECRRWSLLMEKIGAAANARLPPEFDVRSHCDTIASVGGAPSEFLRQACFQQEQQAYNHLKAEWTGVSSDIKSHCQQIAKSGGAGSYYLMDACVDQELQASDQNRSFRFKW